MTQKRSDECVQPTEMWKNEILILGGERSMKGYKKLMDIVAMVEKTVLVVTMLLILVLTVGNVFSRKVIHQSWSFTEELVVAIFVLITLLGAALSAREGGLVGLNLVTERLPKSAKKPVMILILITMYFSGGLIPTYLVVNNLHLTNTFWAMIIPGAISIYNVIITRTYFINSIPKSLEEAAELDGANTFQLLIKVVLPLSKPILAVIGLYYAVGHWNDFYTALIYINDKSLLPLQSFLRDLLMSNKMSMANMQGLDAAAMEAKMQLAQTLKYSVIIVSTVPVLCIYPFIQ